METIVIVCQYQFPEGDAGAVRMYSFARTLSDMGHEVVVIGMGPVTSGIQVFNGIRYLSFRQSNRYVSYLSFSARVLRFLDQWRKKSSIRAVILGACSLDAHLVLRAYCKRNRMILIKDVVEWYSSSQFSHGFWSPIYLLNTIENRFVVNGSVRAISISTYLENYYRKKHIRTERIPIYFDQCDFLKEKELSSVRLNLLYAGSPGTKDKLDVLLSGLSLLDDASLSRLRFTIIGVTVAQIQQMFSLELETFHRILPALNVLGRVSRAVVLENILKSDFTVLLRDSRERYAQAGFPTKVIESISSATPVIMNISSDLGLYFVDALNCIEVKDFSAVSVADSLKRSLLLTKAEITVMSVNAKNLALKFFDKDSYSKQFENLLK